MVPPIKIFFGIPLGNGQFGKYNKKGVLLMPFVKTIKELVRFTPKGVDLIDHTSIFFLRTMA